MMRADLYIIDFGLAKNFIDPRKARHISFRPKSKFVGTASFSSLNSHKMFEQSRRDDIESLGNVMIYMRTGKLPWLKKLKPNITRMERFKQIKNLKISA
mmetsp:Transcript_6288/g.10672  ORF Transcript_6288/g.10672 Transcript_6288/m.10672 type:complete len:99 (+) Transcript_6288:279-575(+)